MYAVGRFSYGQSFPRYKAIVYATVAVAAVTSSLTCTAFVKQAAGANLPVAVQINAVALRKRFPAVNTGINLGLYSNAYAVIFHQATVSTRQSLSAHIFSQHNAAASTGIGVDLYAVAANALGFANLSFSATATAKAHKKSFRAAAASYSGSLAASSFVIRGAEAEIKGLAFQAKAGAKVKLSGETFWRHSATAIPIFQASVGISNSGVILKALGARIISTNFVVAARAHKKIHGSGAAGIDVGIESRAYGRQWPTANVTPGISVNSAAIRKRLGSAAFSFDAMLAGEMFQKHLARASIDTIYDVDGVPYMKHGAKIATAINVGMVARAQRNRMTSAQWSFASRMYGRAQIYKYAAASTGVNLAMNAFAYQNIDVPSPDWRTAILPEEMRDMILPEETREMVLI